MIGRWRTLVIWIHATVCCPLTCYWPLCLAVLTLSGCIFSKGQWSPDSRQLAFLAQGGDEESIFPDRWMLGIGPPSAPPPPAPSMKQLWVADAFTDQFQCLDETKGWLSIPAWAPDGESMAYLRFLPAEEIASGSVGRLELVRRHRNGTTDVLRHQEREFPAPLLELLPYRFAAWSPDGLRIAFPWIGNRSLIVWNVESKSVEAEWPTADLPSFSPDGRWLAVYERGARPGFRVMRNGDWTTNVGFVEVASATQPALWDPVSDAFYIARPPFFLGDASRERLDFGNRRGQQAKCIILRVAVPSMTERQIVSISRNIQKYGQFLGCDFDVDWGREQFLTSILGDGMSSRIETFQPHTQDRARTWHPLDALDAESLLPVGGISCSMDGRWTALRFGLADWSAPIVLHDHVENKVRIWAPTPAVRMRALWAIQETLSRQLREVPSGTPESYGIGAAPTGENPYPSLGHVASHPLELFKPPAVQRIRDDIRRASIDHLAKQGLQLLKDFDPYPTKGTLARRLAEIELVLCYSREDYLGALDALDKLERQTKDDLLPQELLALSIVRVQCLMGAERMDSARWHVNRILDRSESAAAQEPRGDDRQVAPDATDDKGKEQLLLERLWVLYENLFTSESAPTSDNPPPPEPRRMRIPR